MCARARETATNYRFLFFRCNFFVCFFNFFFSPFFIFYVVFVTVRAFYTRPSIVQRTYSPVIVPVKLLNKSRVLDGVPKTRPANTTYLFRRRRRHIVFIRSKVVSERCVHPPFRVTVIAAVFVVVTRDPRAMSSCATTVTATAAITTIIFITITRRPSCRVKETSRPRRPVG